jgi:uncharacterized protein
MRQLAVRDRVGLGWRPEIGSSILTHLDRIDVVEVILDDYLSAPKRKLNSLSTLAAQVPVLYHGVGLGPASSIPIETARLDKLAKLFDILSPDTWSEHLSFVRAGGFEIGHLAAPPRTANTIEGALANLDRIGKAVGSFPALENIATLIDPPGSGMSEPEWVSGILGAADGRMLLDLHNLYANAVNFGFDPFAYLDSFPLDRVDLVHLSGGHWIDEPMVVSGAARGKRLLDDHVHDVPGIVFNLLEALARKTRSPLTVIIERDGAYPEFPVLLNQIAMARSAMEKGRFGRADTECATHGKGAAHQRSIS